MHHCLLASAQPPSSSHAAQDPLLKEWYCPHGLDLPTTTSNQDNPSKISVGQPDIDNSSLRHVSQVILGCAKFIDKTNGGTDQNEEK